MDTDLILLAGVLTKQDPIGSDFFGDARNRIVSCVFHFRQLVNRYSVKLTTSKEQEKFKLLTTELQEAATQTKYFEIFEQLTRLITKKKYREQLLSNWLEWWHKRCANIQVGRCL